MAYSRHYPAINWLSSYSAYVPDITEWYDENVSPHFMERRREIISILGEEASLMEIVKLIGADVLPDSQKATLEIAKVIRLGFLQQNAYHKDDTYVPLGKQYAMMDAIIHAKHELDRVTERAIPVSVFMKTGVLDDLVRMKYTVGNDDLSAIDELKRKITETVDSLIGSYEN